MEVNRRLAYLFDVMFICSKQIPKLCLIFQVYLHILRNNVNLSKQSVHKEKILMRKKLVCITILFYLALKNEDRYIKQKHTLV